MSFQASHLHFAQKIKDIIKPKDLTRYFSGTIYPDSRYITKIDRAQTHTDARIEPIKIINLEDDFAKGWQIHLWYDKLALKHLDQIALGRAFGGPADMKDPSIWIKVTGAKLVEDLYWWKNTDWSQILPYLKFVLNPYQEDPAILESWYQHFRDFYPQKPNIEAYRQQASFMGISTDKVELIQQNATSLLNDQVKRHQIEKVMEQVIEEFKKLI